MRRLRTRSLPRCLQPAPAVPDLEITVQTKNSVMCAFRLAHARGHGWANMAQSIVADQIKQGISPCLTTDNLSEISASQDADDSTVGPGVRFALSHTTGSGRLSWKVRQDNVVEVWLSRSDTVVGGLGGGSINVLKCTFEVGLSGLALIDQEASTVSRVEASPLAEARHWTCLLSVLCTLGAGDYHQPGEAFAPYTSCLQALGLYNDTTDGWWKRAVEAGVVDDAEPFEFGVVVDDSEVVAE